MFIKQISVFLENTTGALKEMTHVLGEKNIDLMALSIADTENFGIVRCIVKDNQIDEALEILKANGYTTKMNNVICVRVPDRPQGLYEILEIVDKAGLAVEYIYSFFKSTGVDALLVLRLSDKDKGVEVFKENGIKLFTQDELNNI